MSDSSSGPRSLDRPTEDAYGGLVYPVPHVPTPTRPVSLGSPPSVGIRTTAPEQNPSEEGKRDPSGPKYLGDGPEDEHPFTWRSSSTTCAWPATGDSQERPGRHSRRRTEGRSPRPKKRPNLPRPGEEPGNCINCNLRGHSPFSEVKQGTDQVVSLVYVLTVYQGPSTEEGMWEVGSRRHRPFRRFLLSCGDRSPVPGRTGVVGSLHVREGCGTVRRLRRRGLVTNRVFEPNPTPRHENPPLASHCLPPPQLAVTQRGSQGTRNYSGDPSAPTRVLVGPGGRNLLEGHVWLCLCHRRGRVGGSRAVGPVRRSGRVPLLDL